MASSGWQGQKNIQTNKYPYMALNLNVWNVVHSGTTLTFSATVRAIVTTGNIYYNGVSVSLTGGGSKSANMNPVSAGGYVDFGTFNCSISGVANTTTSYTVTASLSAGSTASGSASWTLTFDASGTAPSGLTGTINEVGDVYAIFDVNLSSYGSPASTSGRFIEAALLPAGTTAYSGQIHKATKVENVTSATIKVDESSPVYNGSLTITPNTKYAYGFYATNTVLNTNFVQGSLITLPAFIKSVEAENDGNNTITFTINHATDGTSDTVYQEYSTDQQTWIATGDTLVLSVDTPTMFYFRRRNSTGSTPIVEVSVVPDVVSKLYGSANNKSVEITKLYGAVEDDTRFRLTEVVVTPPSQYHYAKLVDSDKLCAMLKSADITFSKSTIVLSIDVKYDMTKYTATVSIGGTAVKLDGKTKVGLVQLMKNCGFEFDADRAESVGSMGGDTDDMFPVTAYDTANAGPATARRLYKLYAGDKWGHARQIFYDSEA